MKSIYKTVQTWVCLLAFLLGIFNDIKCQATSQRGFGIRDCAVQTMNLTECFDIMNNGHGFLLNERREWYRRHLQQTRINSSACFNIFEHVCYVKLYFGLL